MARLVAERSDTLPALAEVFREHGYEGATLSIISKATGLGKGSLYHFFPGGKAEMANVVLEEIRTWFELNVFEVLCGSKGPRDAIDEMFRTVNTYFAAGRRVCLIGVLAISESRDAFFDQVREYFRRWVDVLSSALSRLGRDTATAYDEAEEVVAGIQGAIVLSRALNDPAAFERSLARLQRRLRLDAL